MSACEHKYPEPRTWQGKPVGPSHPPTPPLCIRCGEPKPDDERGQR